MARRITTLCIAASLLTLGACAQTQRAEDLPPPPQGSGTGAGQDGSASVGSADGSVRNPTRMIPGSQEDFVASIVVDRVYFDTDTFDIDVEDQATLRSQAQWLLRYPQTRVTIEGHCDERGTRDYNLALGERRANAAKNYLASLGVGSERINTISYGKERPDAVGSDEGAWARNRRAVTVTVR